jgi:hypothetical protein
MTWDEPVIVVASRPIVAVSASGPELATPVLFALALAFPLATWLVLEILALRRRRASGPASGG